MEISSAHFLVQSPTRFTYTCPVFLEVCIDNIVRVSSLAVSLCLINLSNFKSHLTTLAINLMGNGLHMFGVYASSVSTKVVNLQSLRDCTSQQFISKSVGTYIPPSLPVDGKYSVSASIFERCPFPTITRFIHLSPKSFTYTSFSWPSFIIHNTIIPRITTERKFYTAYEPLIGEGWNSR